MSDSCQPQINGDIFHVLLALDAVIYGESQYEAVYAERLAPNHFRIGNTPFHAKGYHLHDEVETVTEACGCIVVQKTLKPSGWDTWAGLMHTTSTGEPSEAVEAAWKPLEVLGCLHERQGSLFSIAVPPTADRELVEEVLLEGQKMRLWFVENLVDKPLLKEVS